MSGIMSKVLAVILLFTALQSCQMQEQSSGDETDGAKNIETHNADSGSSFDLAIQENTFLGISPGDDIAAHAGKIKKGIHQTGEGDFEVYYIQDEQNVEVGYFHPEPLDESKVGLITITSPEAMTETGIRIGTTYGELKDIYDSMEVHGSEIEGRTHARVKNLLFLLDYQDWSYQVDEDKIPDDVKITEITIDRSI